MEQAPSAERLKVAIILGTTRPGRKADAVARWIRDLATRRHDAAFELVDIADYHLPMLDEPVPPIFGHYEHAHTMAWSEKIASFDAFIFVTPEYNRSIPGALKNAVDFLYREWNNKAAGFVSYGADAAGARAVEHLRLVMAEVHVAGVRSHVTLSLYHDFEAFATLAPQPPRYKQAEELLDQLIAWGKALKALRDEETRSEAAA
jgi:NAD(P)H-dependent FMN reductase